MNFKKLDIIEEMSNCITHGVGVLLSVIGLIVLLILAIHEHDIWEITGFSIFGGSLVLMYLMSTLFHSLIFTKAKKVFMALDQSSIFIFIAGTYTPFLITVLRGWFGWILLVTIWIIAVGGIIFKSVFIDKFTIITVLLYLCMGWIGIILVKPLLSIISFQLIILLLAGGLCYTIGALVLMIKKIPFTHTVWHIFVLGGSACHFIVMYHL